MKDLELNCYFNYTDWVIAYSKEDAITIFCEHLGENREDYDDFLEWETVPLHKELSFHDENVSDNKDTIRTKTTKEWIKEFGRGFMMSTEY